MKSKVRTLLILLLIIVALIILLLIIINKNTLKEYDNDSNETILDPELEGTYGNVNYNNELTNIITRYDYYNVKYCAELYQQAINELLDNYSDENGFRLYQMLDEQYKNISNVRESNVYNLFDNYQKSNIYIDKILSTQLSDSVKAYLVKGKTVSNNSKYDYALIIKLDILNSTFSVYPYEYVIERGYDSLETGDKIEIQNVDSITKNSSNVYEDQSNNVESMAISYFEKLKVDFLYDSEYLYNLLDEEYKEKRFESFEDFENYVNLSRETISNIQMTQYSRDYCDGYIQYIAVDTYNNHYIFKESSVLNYTVLLDDYTIETDDFKNEYENANFQTRAITDVDKVMKMINTKDYRALYNVLDETYKANNFATIDSFIEYINTSFFNENYYTISNISEQGPYYLITITCKKTAAASADTKENKIIISIGEGTSFTMSFALE